jgi:hypothetical protein
MYPDFKVCVSILKYFPRTIASVSTLLAANPISVKLHHPNVSTMEVAIF